MDQSTLNALMIAQVAIAVVMIISILMQNRSEGLGSMFGGGGETFRTKRGLEKLLYNLTLVLGVVFTVLSLIIVKYTG